MKKWKIILSVVLALLIIPVAAGAIYVNFVLDKVTVSDEEFNKDFDLNVNTNLQNSDVKNIALFGVDCRTADYNCDPNNIHYSQFALQGNLYLYRQFLSILLDFCSEKIIFYTFLGQ